MLKVRIRKKSFSQRKLFFKRFYWANRMPLQQPVHYFSAQSKTILHSKWRNDEKLLLSKKAAQKVPPEAKKAVLKPIRKTFAPSPKTMRNFLQNFFLRNNPMHTQNLVLTTLSKKFRQYVQRFPLKSEKKLNCLDAKTFTLPRKAQPDIWIAVLKTLTKKLAKSSLLFAEKVKTTKKAFFCWLPFS